MKDKKSTNVKRKPTSLDYVWQEYENNYPDGVIECWFCKECKKYKVLCGGCGKCRVCCQVIKHE